VKIKLKDFSNTSFSDYQQSFCFVIDGCFYALFSRKLLHGIVKSEHVSLD